VTERGADDTAGEIRRLQRCVTDLLGVLALPAIWGSQVPSDIVSALLDVLLGMLRLDFAYVRLSDPIHGSPIEWLRTGQRRSRASQAGDLSRVLEPWLADPLSTPVQLPNPVGEGDVTIAAFRLGLQEEVAVLVAGSVRGDFPTEIEKLLLRVASNQAAMGLQEARLSAELRRAAAELEQRVTDRTSQLAAANEELRKEVGERIRAEDALRRSEAYLAEAQRLSATGSFGWRPASGEIVWSAETYRIFQLDPATTKPSVDLVLACTHPEDSRRVQEFIEGTSVETREWEIEHRLLMSDGSVKHLRVVARAARDESSGRTEYIGSVMDVTATVEARRALEKANSEIQAALRARFEAALAERTRIAQELHDTLLQGFAGVTLQLKAAELALPERPGVAAETLARVHRLATEALREARESVWDLRGTELDELDLIDALRGRALAATAGSNLAVTVTARGVPRRLPRRIEAAALRVGREALANAVKHAEASRIEIDVQFGAALLALQIRDDGRGFTQDQLETAIQNGHFGITSIQDRARQTGGTCEVGPGVQGGTVVTLRLPLG
jgi:signal transduction histidine kinase